ncbi:hypothetical protein BC830DRAFT_1174836 [Chytriomyces sp. MP71]|nr:hypothetical protein BC830DRAFT_1174836 [Chytriomyces sp. MP71]
MWIRFASAALAVVALLAAPVAAHEDAHKHIPFEMGDLVPIECPAILANGTISATEYLPLHCADTNTPLALPYGMDALLQCVWALDAPMYTMISNSLNKQAAYSCRMPMSKEGGLYFPLTFAFWGQIEDTHIHLMTHWNFLFHAIDGFFLGGTVYPLRDHWVMAVKGSIIMIHGPVRWFAGHTFEGTLQSTVAKLEAAKEEGDVAAGDTIPAQNEAAKEKPRPSPRPIIANSKDQKGNIKPVDAKDLPTVSKLMSAVPRAMVFFYIVMAVGATGGLSGLVYYAYLKPKLLLEKKNK